jgi:hypothetical protein
MRTWLIEEIKNSLTFRDADGKPNYTQVVGLLFKDEIQFLNELNIGTKKLTTGYNIIIFKDNIN